MSRADEIFIQNCRDILDNGIWDTDREVRPRWEDGSPAHTLPYADQRVGGLPPCTVRQERDTLFDSSPPE